MNLILKEDKEDVLHLILNRPEKKNALTLEMMGELIAHLKAISNTTRILILEGKGYFSAGMDLEEVVRYGEKCTEAMGAVLYTLATLPVITLAKVNGGAFAGGLGLVAATDLAFASEEAFFCLPELQRGLVPALVYSLLKNQCVPRFLNELILTSVPITAQNAHAIGLLNGVVPTGSLDKIATQVVNAILKTAPHASKMYKKHCLKHDDLRTDFDEALALHRELLAGGEPAEGIRAYAEKRVPQWK